MGKRVASRDKVHDIILRTEDLRLLPTRFELSV